MNFRLKWTELTELPFLTNTIRPVQGVQYVLSRMRKSIIVKVGEVKKARKNENTIGAEFIHFSEKEER